VLEKAHGFTKGPFNGGSALEYLLKRPHLLNAFKAQDCYDLVVRPLNMVPHPDPELNQVLLVETTFDEAEPSRTVEVDDKITAHDNQIQESFASTEARIAEAAFPAAKTADLRFANDNKRAERLFDRASVIASIEKAYTSKRADYLHRKDKYATKKAACHHIFSSSFSAVVLNTAKSHLDQGHYRRALYEIDQTYSSEAGGVEGQMLTHEMLSVFKLNGKDIAGHLDAFDTLVDASTLAGYDYEPKQLFLHFTNSFTRGNNRDYDDIIKNAKLNKLTYAACRSQIIERHSNLLMQGDVSGPAKQSEKLNAVSLQQKPSVQQFTQQLHNVLKSDAKFVAAAAKQVNKFSNQSTNINKNTVTVTCDFCKRKGHDAAKCWGKKPCPHCGTVSIHHNPLRCANKHTASNVTDDDDGEDGNVAEVTTKVSALAPFQQKWKKQKR